MQGMKILSMSKQSEMQKFEGFEVLSFDCYGTLIDWENGILNALRPLFSSREIGCPDEEILESYAEFEWELEQQEYIGYREVLRRVVEKFGERKGFEPKANELDCLADSLKEWNPFPDTIEALKTLNKRFKLAIISNIDDDLLAHTVDRLKTRFDWLITSQQARVYKPSKRMFEFALEKLGISPTKILHVAQSMYHDIIPAKSMGLSTAWIDRRRGKKGPAAAPLAYCRPDIKVPDLESLVLLIGMK
jgi:2-haloacid dehalogenase